MSELAILRAPLPARFRLGAGLLLACRRFSADALLLAAEAFDEFAQAARFENAPVAAAQASELAARLRATAPERAGRARPSHPYRPARDAARRPIEQEHP